MAPSNRFLGLGSSFAAGRSPWSAVGTCNIPVKSFTGGGWLVSGGGVGLVAKSSFVGADDERRVVVHQHPLKILSGTVDWNVCLRPLAQAGVVKYTE